MQLLYRDTGLRTDDECLIQEAKDAMVDVVFLLDSCLCLRPHALV